MTYQECFETKEFKTFFKEEKELIEYRRQKIIDSAPERSRLKASIFARLNETGLFKPDWMCNQFNLIQQKRSLHSKNTRDFVEAFVRKCAFRTAVFYEKLAERAVPIKEKKPRKSRVKNKPTSDDV